MRACHMQRKNDVEGSRISVAVCVRPENKEINKHFLLVGPHEISVLIELTIEAPASSLRHLRHHSAIVALQSYACVRVVFIS